MLAAIPFPDISPNLVAFEIAGREFALRWYALAYIFGILIAWRISVALARRPALWGGTAPFTEKQCEDFLTWVVLGIILGGRFGYVVFYEPEKYLADPWQILQVWNGGMAFHGGFLGIVVAVILFSWRNGIRLSALADAAAVATPPGLLLGRLANFVNAELWGRPTDLPWAVIFPGDAAQSCAGIPYGECARHPSQLYEAGLEGLLLGLILWLMVRAGALKTPWRVTGAFFLGYGLARMFVELFRQADAQFISAANPMGYYIQFGDWGLSMGQLLSLPMVLVGLFLILRRSRAAG